MCGLFFKHSSDNIQQAQSMKYEECEIDAKIISITWDSQWCLEVTLQDKRPIQSRLSSFATQLLGRFDDSESTDVVLVFFGCCSSTRQVETVSDGNIRWIATWRVKPNNMEQRKEDALTTYRAVQLDRLFAWSYFDFLYTAPLQKLREHESMSERLKTCKVAYIYFGGLKCLTPRPLQCNSRSRILKKASRRPQVRSVRWTNYWRSAQATM